MAIDTAAVTTLHPQTVLFDDDRGRFGPLLDLRAVFDQRTGVFTMRERMERRRGPVAALWVPEHLETLERSRSGAMVNHLPEAEAFLCVNGALADPEVACAIDRPEAVVDEAGDVAAALLPRTSALHFLRQGELEEWVPRRAVKGRILLRRPWHILDALDSTLRADLALAANELGAPLPAWATAFGDHPLHLADDAQVLPGVVIDCTDGPVAIHGGTVIRPHAVLVGPCSVGPRTIVGDHALIKARTSIGPVCRVAGEVGATIIQGWSNKSHDGHLGDSIVGEWVNLGAGTLNSNLLNTYGEVVVTLEPGASRERTGRRFMGALIGDHVKTAIATRLMTGAVLGTGAMVATTRGLPITVPRFAWIVEERTQRFRWERFEETMRTMMSRRQVEPAAAYVERMRTLHESGGADPSSAQAAPARVDP